MRQYFFAQIAVPLYFFFTIACFTLHAPWCTLFLALFGGNICEIIALMLLHVLPPPSLPSFFFTVDSSSSSDSEKESLGEDIDDEEEDEEEEEEEMDSDLEGMASTPKRRRLANKIARTASLKSGLYPEFLGIHSPSQDLNPNDNSALDYFLLLWPASLCDTIANETDRYADETDRYAYERGTANWRNTSTAEIWTFLRITILMGVKRLPTIKLY